MNIGLDHLLNLIDQIIPLLLELEEDLFAKAFEHDARLLRSGLSRPERAKVMADLEQMLSAGPVRISELYLTKRDGSPDVTKSARYSSLVNTIRSVAMWRRLMRL